MKKLIPLLFILMLASCGTLDRSGVYNGDKALYTADQTIVASYDTLHAFVKWEMDNREVLEVYPEIKQAADHVRLNARRWINSAIVLREAYASNPTVNGKVELEKSVNFLRAALIEAIQYINTQ